MKTLAELLKEAETPKPGGKAPAPHELAEMSNMIEQAGLFTAKYGRTYWLGKLKRASMSYSEMFGILKQIGNMPGKYNKGGTLTNLLTKRANQIKNARAKKV